MPAQSIALRVARREIFAPAGLAPNRLLFRLPFPWT